jgi:hypothetical protein
MEKNIIDLEVAEDLEKSGATAIALVDVPAIEKDWMAFKRQEFVKPGAGESEDEFIPRCISKLVGDEGYETDQAAAICYSTWREEHAKIEMNDAFLWPDGQYYFEDEIEGEFAASYTDYPQAARDAAQRALDWADKNGWGSCGTLIGKARASQLAKGRPVTEETIARMASFARHKRNSDTPYGEGCGKLMWDAWGGDAGIAWASRKLEQIRRQEMSYDTSALPIYVDQLPKKKDKFALQGIPLPRGEKVILQAEDEDYDRGLIVELMPEGGYNVQYWFNTPDNIEPQEVRIDGETITDSGSLVYLGYHPELRSEAFAPASGNPGDRPLARIPKEERGRTGSAKNEPGDTKTTRGGIEVSEEVEGTLKDKIEKHNEKNTQDSQKATLGMLKAVWRRGAGAYSVGTPGKRGMQRSQWAMARVNAFLNILAGNRSGYDKDYNQDNDLLPKGHPKHSEQKMTKMIFASEDQQILVGPVAIPDMEIVRKYDEGPDKGKPYWVRFSKNVIRKMAEKFMRETRNHDTNILHDNKVDGKSYVMETWIVENEEDKANSMYNMDVPVGTWMVKMRVTDPAIWKQVKSGRLNGFSLEGNFMDAKDFEAYQKDKQLYDKVMRILKSS